LYCCAFIIARKISMPISTTLLFKMYILKLRNYEIVEVEECLCVQCDFLPTVFPFPHGKIFDLLPYYTVQFCAVRESNSHSVTYPMTTINLLIPC
jgi:hypothetical protein